MMVLNATTVFTMWRVFVDSTLSALFDLCPEYYSGSISIKISSIFAN